MQTLVMFTSILTDSSEKLLFACKVTGFTTEICSVATKSNFNYPVLFNYLRARTFKIFFREYYAISLALNSLKMSRLLRDLGVPIPELDCYIDFLTIPMIKMMSVIANLSGANMAKLIIRHECFSFVSNYLGSNVISLAQAKYIFSSVYIADAEYERSRHRKLQRSECTSRDILSRARTASRSKDYIDYSVVLVCIYLSRAGFSFDDRHFKDVRDIITWSVLKFLILEEHSRTQTNHALWLPYELVLRISALELLAAQRF